MSVYRENLSQILVGSGCASIVAALGCGAMVYMANESIKTWNRISEGLDDPTAKLACGTSAGPFEVNGHLEIESFKYIGGRKILGVGNEFRLEYLDKDFNFDLLEYGGEYKWVDNGHEIEIEIIGNDGKRLEVEYVASCVTR